MFAVLSIFYDGSKCWERQSVVVCCMYLEAIGSIKQIISSSLEKSHMFYSTKIL